MNKRKTIDVQLCKDYANTYLDLSNDDLIGERQGVSSFLEIILMNTDNYNGFMYRDGYPCDDETRRRYL